MERERLERRRIAIEEEIINDTIGGYLGEHPDRQTKKPHSSFGLLKLLIGLFLVALIIFWMFPYYYIKENPHPKNIPTLDEVYPMTELNDSNGSTGGGIFIDSLESYSLYVDSINPIVKGVADRVSSLACPDSANYIVCQSKALYFFVRDNMVYVKDPKSFEYVKGPLEALNNRGGDCDDMAVLLSSLLGSIGISTRLVFVPNHVYVEAYLPDASSGYMAYKGKDWVALDATCKECDFGKISYKNAKEEKTYVDVS